MMKKLIAIGYWNSKFFQEDRFIWPQELVKDSVNDDMLKLSSYLSKGKSAIAWKGYSSCRICKKLLGTCCLTDGVYIWPEKLEHYILEHKIYLPDDFVNHAKNNSWKIKKTNYDGEYRGKIDYDCWTNWCWTNWCKNHRNPKLEPNFNYEIYDAPKETGEGKLTVAILHDLFWSIENLDLIVEKLEIDNRELPKEIVDKDNEGEYLWTAKVEREFPLLTVVGCKNISSSALVFENKKPIIYCEHKQSMYGEFSVSTRFCPDLGLRHKKYF